MIYASLHHKAQHSAQHIEVPVAGSFMTSHHQETGCLLLVFIWENPGEYVIGLTPARGELWLAVPVQPKRWDCGETKCPTKKSVIVNGRERELIEQK